MKHETLHRQLPAERFYWGVLDIASLPARPSREQLGYLFEAVLPCPVEEVHAAYVPLPGKQVLACGMLRETIAEQSQNALTLSPAQLPAFIDVDVDPHQLNLLKGDFEPAPVRRLRRTVIVSAAAMLAAISLILTLGFALRTGDLRQQAENLHAERLAILAKVLEQSSTPDHMPPELRMTAELRQLRQTRAQPAHGGLDHVGSQDVAGRLSQLLAHWPEEDREIHLQTEHLSVTPRVITLRGLLPDSTQAQQLAENFRNIDGWRLEQPQVTSSRENVQAVLRFIASKEIPE